MAAFASFYEILPDPAHTIGLAGEYDASGSAGAGFAAVKLKSNQKLMGTTHASGRQEDALNMEQFWSLDIQYNPMPCEAFHTVYAFLMLKQTTLQPFYVVLPQYSSQNITNKTLSTSAVEGAQTIIATGTGVTVGSIFNLANHEKTYLVTRVETETDYFSPEGSPGAGKERLHITPSLFTDTASGYALDFSTPKMVVTFSTDIQSYQLGSDNLFNYSLSLEEALV